MTRQPDTQCSLTTRPPHGLSPAPWSIRPTHRGLGRITRMGNHHGSREGHGRPPPARPPASATQRQSRIGPLRLRGSRSGDRPRVLPWSEPPGDDPLGVDADQDLRGTEGLGSAANLDGPRPPGADAGQVVDHDRRPAGALDVAELLGLLQPMPGDVDGVQLGVVRPADRGDVGGAVGPDGRDPPEPPLAVQVGQLGLAEDAPWLRHHWSVLDVADDAGCDVLGSSTISSAPAVRCSSVSTSRLSPSIPRPDSGAPSDAASTRVARTTQAARAWRVSRSSMARASQAASPASRLATTIGPAVRSWGGPGPKAGCRTSTLKTSSLMPQTARAASTPSATATGRAVGRRHSDPRVRPGDPAGSLDDAISSLQIGDSST